LILLSRKLRRESLVALELIDLVDVHGSRATREDTEPQGGGAGRTPHKMPLNFWQPQLAGLVVVNQRTDGKVLLLHDGNSYWGMNADSD
jgi:hypothetical protein